MYNLVSAILWVCIGALPVTSHEMWIEAPAKTSPEGQYTTPVVFIGEELEGKRYVFDPVKFEQAIWAGPETTSDLRLNTRSQGDVRLDAFGYGLHILALQSYPGKHLYPTESAFLKFVRSVGLEGRVNTAQPSVTEDGYVHETYQRYAKTLVRFDGKNQSDKRVGLEKEWVREQVGFRLYSGRKTVENQPAWLYCRPSDGGEVKTALLETDDTGLVHAELPAQSQCLLNAVILRQQADGSWFSEWVSTFFDTK
ncbi:hypothetical protein [Ruegeria profundi]|nr:hypothetical protein [Ruegeria profundi]